MTTTVTGMVTAYDLTVGVIVEMDTAIYMLDPDDSPMLTGTGADGLSVIGSKPTNQIEFEWMTDGLLTPRSKIAAATTGDAYVTVTAGDRTKFSTGDVLRVAKSGAAEYMRITGYGTTAHTLLVTRAFSGTATNYSSDTTVLGLGTALPEGSEPENARSLDRDPYSNVTQIFGPTEISMSGTQQSVPRYGVPNEFSHQIYKRTVEQGIAREQAILYGVKYNSTTTKIRTTGGLDYFITDNVDATSTQLTVTTIQSLQQGAYNLGAGATRPDRLICNVKSLSHLTDIANTSIVRTTPVDTMRGRMPVAYIDTEFGRVTVVRNRWCLPENAFLVNREGIQRRPLRPFRLERLAKTGDSDQVQILCEEGYQVKGAKHMGKFTVLSY